MRPAAVPSLRNPQARVTLGRLGTRHMTNHSLTISRADACDLDRILAVQKAAYASEAMIYGADAVPPLRETLAGIRADLDAKVILKAGIGGVIVGSVRVARAGQSCLIGRLSVDPAFQRRGIGGALLAAAEAVFAGAVVRAELFTGSKSVANLRLYERHGYVRFREEPLSPQLTLVYLQKSLECRVDPKAV